MKKLFNNSYNKQIDGTGLAIFRIAYSIILLCEIMQMFYFRHLIFDKIPYIELPEISSAIPILIWAVSVVFIMVGLFTRTATIINYIMSLVL
ncbi:MAG: thiol-disulfide oxidoreductase, partial [Bacteroidetes bacterium]|nr:thiol-disulfide oxidoreductase [Bacteroidota bacterium]